MEDAGRRYPSLPSNYVSIVHLQERWIKEQQRIQEEKEREQDMELHSPARDNDTAQDDARPKFRSRLKSRQDRAKQPATTVERAQKRGPAKVIVDRRRAGRVKSRNPEQVKLGDQGRESLVVKKDDRTVEGCHEKPKMEYVDVVGDEIKDGEQKTAGKEVKKKKNRGGRKARAEEEVAGGAMPPASKNGNEGKFSCGANQMDGINRRMDKLSVNPGKLRGRHGSTSTRTDGRPLQWVVSGRFDRQKAGLVWVRKGESDCNVANTSCSAGSYGQG